MSFLRWVSEKLSVESLQDVGLFGERPQAEYHKKPDEHPSENITSPQSWDTVNHFPADSNSYELLTAIGKGFNDIMTVTLGRYKRTGEQVAVRRINLDNCTNEMFALLQGVEDEYKRSVQASHILISSDGQVYLSGLRSIFSMISHGQRLRVIHDFPKYSVKILPWLSPELLQQNLQGYDAKSDIYSLGITACELANGHVPFKNMPATQMLLEKLNGTVPCLLDTTTIPAEELLMTNSQSAVDSGIVESSAACGTRATNGEQVQHPYNRTFSGLFHNFVELCLQREPEQRPSASALLNHSFVKQLKRRVVEVLPDLLRPVTPMTDLEGTHPHELRGVAGLTSSLEHLDVEDWDF
ncbi:hypothetical protein chiPu_0017129 [Chiloscyllium punctatum]|uniref:Protein kinase domain-containing protein n=1 Tax=Chiloscyllium punctatum TaxID=137246 RepID=A0A401T7M9_CHIPU|nr:hypothetical protein [Chiloscyllium punctatum]